MTNIYVMISNESNKVSVTRNTTLQKSNESLVTDCKSVVKAAF